MNCFYLLMKARHTSNKYFLVEQELFLITAGKKIYKNSQTNKLHQNQSVWVFIVHTVVDGLTGNTPTFEQVACLHSVKTGTGYCTAAKRGDLGRLPWVREDISHGNPK